MSELLEIKNVTKKFGNKTVLDGVSFTVGRNKIVGLLGKNGAGKSTVIKLVNDLLTVSSGEILFDGKKIGIESKKRIAYLPERTYLDKSRTVKSTVKLFSEFYEDFDPEKAYSLLEKLGLDAEQKLSKMSKGMLEKVQLVLVMSRSADLYILDEPLGGVDPATRDYILDTILTNFGEGSSVLISTHLIADIERILDEVVFIENGRTALCRAADELREEENASVDEIFRRMFKC